MTMTSKDISIQLESVSKRFNIGYKKHENALYRMIRFFSGRENRKILQVLENINISVAKGERVGIIGRNGSGKSTLANALAGRPDIQITKGEIDFEGQDRKSVV